MTTTTARRRAAEDETKSSLARVFLGEEIDLEGPMGSIVVGVWGARAMVERIPHRIGQLVAKLVGLQGIQAATPEWLAANVPLALEGAMRELWVLLQASVPVLEADDALDQLTATDLVTIAQAVLRKNQRFFDGMKALRSALPIARTTPTTPAGGSGLPPSSSGEESD